MSWLLCNLSVSQLRAIIKSVSCICLLLLLQTSAKDSRIEKTTFAKAQDVKPITKQNLLSALKLGEKQKTKVETYIDLIKGHYVEFKMADGDEQEIRTLGRYLGKEDLDKLIFSIRPNYAHGIALTSARIIQNVEKGISLIELNINQQR